MPLPKPLPRQKYHRRSITCDGFLREDGLYDIEAHMSDIKSISVEDSERGYVAAGEPFHDMWLRVTIDETFKVHEVVASMEATPFEICPTILDNFKKIEGTQIGPGWRSTCRELVGGVAGCTHLNELLPVIATTAYQSLWPFKDEETKSKSIDNIIDTCHTWSAEGELVAKIHAMIRKAS